MRRNPSWLLHTIRGALACLALVVPAGAQCPTLDDSFEPNDTCTAAVALPLGSSTGLFVSVTDEDFYAVTVAADDQAVISQTYVAQQAELMLEIYSDAACTTLVASSGWGGGSNQVTAGNGSGATRDFYLRVRVLSGLCNDYDLSVFTQPDPCLVAGLDDALEDNDSCLLPRVLAPGTYANLFIAAVDLDYYAITVPPGDEVMIDQTYAPSLELYMDLFVDPGCITYVGTSGWGAGSNSLSWANSTGSPATIYLACHVDDSSGSCTNYDLTVTVAADPCQDPASDDVLEDNDTCATARTITTQTYGDLFVSRFDTDVYTFDLAPGGYADITVDHIQDNGDIDIVLYDDSVGACLDSTSWVAASQTFADSEVISYSNLTGATVTYYLHVELWVGSGHGCNDYDMHVSLFGNQVATPTCVGDATFDAGSGPVACPCGNHSLPGAGEGCLNSQGRGASLRATGSNTVSGDDLMVHVEDARPLQPGMLVQGASLTAVPFKDGILCAGNPTERIEVLVLDATGGGTTTSSIVTEGNITGPGLVRFYQFWYRDPVISVCGSGSNFSSGLRVSWL